MLHLREAQLSDVPQIREIYSPFVLHHHISFEEEVPSLEEMEKRWSNITSFFPYFVCVDTSKDTTSNIAGYCYATKFKERKGYRWAAEVTIYIRDGYHRKGIGRALLLCLCESLKSQGCYTAHANISLPNEGSVALHESCGFKKVGECANLGYKAGAWRVVGWWQLSIAAPIDNPQDPVPYNALGAPITSDIIQKAGLKLVNSNNNKLF